MEDGLRRLPPQSVDAEMAVLSTLFNFESSLEEILRDLKPHHFYKQVHQEIFQSLLKLYSSNQSFDVLILSEELKNSPVFKDAGGMSYLEKIENITPSTTNYMAYVKILIDKSRLRRLIEVTNHMRMRAYQEEEDVDTLIAEAEQQIFSLTDLRQDKSYRPAQEFADETWVSITNMYNLVKDGKPASTSGISTLLTELDKLTLGFKRQELIILGARPSMGKTAFCLQLIRNIGLEQNIPVILYSLEMPGVQIAYRVFSALAQVESTKLQLGGLSPDEISRLTRAAGIVSNSPFFINDQSALNLVEIRSDLRRLRRDLERKGRQLGLVVVDYLQLVHSIERKATEQEKISDISRGLKGIAREFNVPVLALSQLSRKVEERADKTPMLSDLRESGAIEQDADMVLFLHREEYYQRDKPELAGLADVLVAKNRNGPRGKAQLRFEQSTGTFFNRVQS